MPACGKHARPAPEHPCATRKVLHGSVRRLLSWGGGLDGGACAHGADLAGARRLCADHDIRTIPTILQRRRGPGRPGARRAGTLSLQARNPPEEQQRPLNSPPPPASIPGLRRRAPTNPHPLERSCFMTAALDRIPACSPSPSPRQGSIARCSAEFASHCSHDAAHGAGDGSPDADPHRTGGECGSGPAGTPAAVAILPTRFRCRFRVQDS